jgi:type IV pilus assembly protein PilM
MDTEISSTEKLLETIKGARAADEVAAQQARRKAASGRSRPKKSLLRSRKKGNVVGVHIDKERVFLAKFNPHQAKPQFLAYQTVDLPRDEPVESDKFALFLRNAVLTFIGRESYDAIWCFMSSAQAGVSRVVFPKLSRSQIANAVMFKAKKDFEYNETLHTLDYRIQDKFTEDGVVKTSVLISVVSRDEVDKIKDLFESAGLELSGITLPCFAFENLFQRRMLNYEGDTAATLFIGYKYSRIDIFRNNELHLTRWIRSGSHSLVGALVESASERGDTLSPEDARNILAHLESEETDTVLPLIPYGEEEVFEMMLPAVDRIVRQLERTFEGYGNQVGSARVGTLFVTGGPGRYWRIIKYFEDQLTLKCGLLNPFASRRAYEAVALPPESEDAQLKLSAAAGLALSDPETTPNLMETYREREVAEKKGSAARYGFLAAGMALILIGAAFMFLRFEMAKKESRLAALSQAQKRHGTIMDGQVLMQVAAKLATFKAAKTKKAEKLLPVAILKEISRLTQANVHLDTLTFLRAEEPKETPATRAAKKKGEEEKISGVLMLKGMVDGDPREQESVLTGWMLKLASSPVIMEPRVDSKKREPYSGKEALFFNIKAKIVDI